LFNTFPATIRTPSIDLVGFSELIFYFKQIILQILFYIPWFLKVLELFGRILLCLCCACICYSILTPLNTIARELYETAPGLVLPSRLERDETGASRPVSKIFGRDKAHPVSIPKTSSETRPHLVSSRSRRDPGVYWIRGVFWPLFIRIQVS